MQTPRLTAIIILGAAAVSAAIVVQHHILAQRRLPPLPNPFAAQHATPTPQLPSSTNLQAQRQQEATIRAAVDAHPTDHAARWNMINFLIDSGQMSQAAAQADALARLGVHDPREELALANVFLVLKQYPQAEGTFRQIIVQQPKRTEGWQGLATALYLQQRYLEAMEAGREAVQLAPNAPGAHLALASAALQYGLQFRNSTVHHVALDIAHAEFLQLLKQFPNNASVCLRTGQSDIGLSRWAEAVGPLTQAIALDPSAEGYYNLAYAEKNGSNLDGSRHTLEEALARFPNDAALHDLYGQVLQQSPDPNAADEALAQFQAAVRLDPNNAKYFQNEGTALLRMNRLAEAQTAFVASIRRDPNQAFPYQQLAVIYTRQGDVVRAREADKMAAAMVFNQQQLLQIQSLTYAHPDSIPLHLILGDRYRQLGMSTSSRDEYLLVAQLDPRNAHARQGLAALRASHAQ